MAIPDNIVTQLEKVKTNIPLVYNAGKNDPYTNEYDDIPYMQTDRMIQLTELSSIPHKIKVYGENIWDEEKYLDPDTWQKCSYNGNVHKLKEIYPSGKYRISFDFTKSLAHAGYSSTIYDIPDDSDADTNTRWDLPIDIGFFDSDVRIVSTAFTEDVHYEKCFFADRGWTIYNYFSEFASSAAKLEEMLACVSNIKLEAQWYNKGYVAPSNPSTVSIYGPNLWSNDIVASRNPTSLRVDGDKLITKKGSYAIATISWEKFHEMTGLNPGDTFHIQYIATLDSPLKDYQTVNTAWGNLRWYALQGSGEFNVYFTSNQNDPLKKHIDGYVYIPETIEDTSKFNNYLTIYGNSNAGEVTYHNIQISKFKLNKYYPYQEKQTITLDSTREIDSKGLKNCHIVSDTNDNITVKFNYSYDAWKRYLKFWDSHDHHQVRKGNQRIDYANGFGGIGWNPYTFNPKARIKSFVASLGFHTNGYAGDLRKLSLFEDDVINIGDASYLFNNSLITHVGNINITGSMASTFLNSYVRTVDKLTLSETTSYNTYSLYCGRLTDVTFDGIIGKTFYVRAAYLSKQSLISAISILSDTTSGLTATFLRTNINKQFETSDGANDGETSTEWTDLMATKPNWTFVLN